MTTPPALVTSATSPMPAAPTAAPPGPVLTVPGIDVSNWQGPAFAWQAYAGKLGFAFIKASEGLDFKDPDYGHNYAAVSAISTPTMPVRRGPYHFLRPHLPGAQQARFFLDVAEPTPGDLVMVDVETFDDGAGGELSPAEVSACVGAFADITRALTGTWPIVYTDQVMAEGGYVASVGACPSYIANPSNDVLPRPIGPWNLVSFEQTGQRGGVDVDVFYGSTTQLDRLTVLHMAPPTPPPAPRRPAILAAVDISRPYAAGAAVPVFWLASHDGGQTYR